jgi:hypothetical protein
MIKVASTRPAAASIWRGLGWAAAAFWRWLRGFFANPLAVAALTAAISLAGNLVLEYHKWLWAKEDEHAREFGKLLVDISNFLDEALAEDMRFLILVRNQRASLNQDTVDRMRLAQGHFSRKATEFRLTIQPRDAILFNNVERVINRVRNCRVAVFRIVMRAADGTLPSDFHLEGMPSRLQEFRSSIGSMLHSAYRQTVDHSKGKPVNYSEPDPLPLAGSTAPGSPSLPATRC